MSNVKDAYRDTVADRLAQMLMMAYQNIPIRKEDVMGQFCITERTFYRDINRLGRVIQKNEDGFYELDPQYRASLTPSDLKQFAIIAGVDGMFSQFGSRFVHAVLHTLVQGSYLVKGTEYESHDEARLSHFKDFEQAIENNQACGFKYDNKDRKIEPYKLINYQGIWYLAGVEDKTLKAFNISKMTHSPVVYNERFSPDIQVSERIENEDSIWFSEEKQEVILKVNAEVAYYFERRKLLPHQQLVKSLESGELIISCQMSHPNQVLPLIRYWLPNVSIISPACLRQKFVAQIKDYLTEPCNDL